jgi:hypothetical protein
MHISAAKRMDGTNAVLAFFEVSYNQREPVGTFSRHAADGRSATHRCAQYVAEWLSVSLLRLQSAASAWSSSKRKNDAKY